MTRGFLSEGSGRRDRDSGGRSDLVDVEVVLRRETEKAWGFASPHKLGELIWFPQSQGELEMTAPQPRPKWVLTCDRWIAEAKGLV